MYSRVRNSLYSEISDLLSKQGSGSPMILDGIFTICGYCGSFQRYGLIFQNAQSLLHCPMNFWPYCMICSNVQQCRKSDMIYSSLLWRIAVNTKLTCILEFLSGPRFFLRYFYESRCSEDLVSVQFSCLQLFAFLAFWRDRMASHQWLNLIESAPLF